MRTPENTTERVEGARRRGWRDLVRGQRGAVMGEAVIMLPVLILIWSIILYIHFGFRDAQRNQVTLRESAWTHAYGGCNSTPSDRSTTIDSGAQFDGESAGGISGLASVLTYVSSNLFRIEEFGARREVSVSRPNQLGGGTHTMSWGFLCLCNEDQSGDDGLPDLLSYFF